MEMNDTFREIVDSKRGPDKPAKNTVPIGGELPGPEEINTRATPGPRWKPRFHIVAPKPGKKVAGVILSRQLVGVNLHYYERRKRPCRQPKRFCEWCELVGLPRWYGYLAIYNPLIKTIEIAEFTEYAYHSCPILQDPEANLRGLVVTLTRQGNHSNGPVVVNLFRSDAQQWVPEDPGVLPELWRHWSRQPFQPKTVQGEEIPLPNDSD